MGLPQRCHATRLAKHVLCVQSEVATVHVDLPKKVVTITTKPGKTLSDAKIKEVVTYSGYTMGKIIREK